MLSSSIACLPQSTMSTFSLFTAAARTFATFKVSPPILSTSKAGRLPRLGGAGKYLHGGLGALAQVELEALLGEGEFEGGDAVDQIETVDESQMSEAHDLALQLVLSAGEIHA